MIKSYNHIHFLTYLIICISFLAPFMLYAADIQKKDTLSPVNQFNPIIQSKDFNQGLITSFDQLINGQIAGVQIMSNGGSPFSGSTIQIRGGASVNTTNEPLIVIDGVPFETGANWYDISTQLNPNDIESISILKDAASASFYGMRASKGVILITTKKGYLGKLKINFTSTTSLQTLTGDATMLSPNQFRNLINTEGTDIQKAQLGSTSTNWNNQIYKPALATDNHISLSGGLFNSIPFRVSIGHVGQDGILITDRTEKLTGSIVLSPSFFDNHLNISLNLRTSQNNNRFADQNSIIAAKEMNPTQPVTSDDAVFQNYFGGYWQSYLTNTTGVAASLLAVRNPVATLNLTDNTSNDHIYSGRLDIDYKIHFLPEIHFKLMYGLDSYQINEKTYIEKTNPGDFSHGQTGWMNQDEKYETINAGFQYNKKINNKHQLDATVAFESQHYNSSDSSAYAGLDNYDPTFTQTTTESYFISFIGQASYTYDNTYTLSVGLRRDGSSRLSINNRWGNCPSASLTYNLTSTLFKNNKTVNDLKVRFSYGVTGQNPPSTASELPTLSQNNTTSGFVSGGGNLQLKPPAQIPDLTFETKTSYDLAIDYGLFHNQMYGCIDLYTQRTNNLLNFWYVSGGANTSQTVLGNSGSLLGKGIEFSINGEPVRTEKLKWKLGFNMTYQFEKITNYPYDQQTWSPYALSGCSFINAAGNAPNMFYVQKQVYDQTGKPIEGVYQNIDGNGQLSNNDYIAYHSPVPDLLFGLNTQLIYGKWSAGCSFRASIGNYVYNMNNALFGVFSTNNGEFGLNNIATEYLKTGFKTYQENSSYYVENASFLKLDNITLGYNAGEITKGVYLKLSAIVQNVFTITGYTGADPEVPGGLDYGFYPRQGIYSFDILLDF